MPHERSGGKSMSEKYRDRTGQKNPAFRIVARIIFWALLAFIAVSAFVELIKGMGY